MAQLLSETDIQTKLKDLPTWEQKGSEIQCKRKFKDFVEAINFVNRLVEPAEASAHHPDIAISYNTVTITLTTHDSGGLTQKDIDMATVISGIS